MSTVPHIRVKAALLLMAVVMTGCGWSESPIARDVSEVDDLRLRAASRDSANWLMYGRTYEEQRYSPLAQIREETIDRLGLLWSRELGTRGGLEATPLIVNGIIYTTGAWSVVYALDAGTGELLWTYDPQVPRSRARVLCCDAVNRGLAAYRGKLYVGTLDGRLIALDADAGKVVWSAQTTPPDQPYSITGAPRVGSGLVFIGNGGAEFGVRGYVSAYDAESGQLRWRTYTVPGNPADGFESPAMERAAATWNGEWWTAGGGGTAWDAIVYDPDLEIVYVGTGNGSPWFRDLRSPGGGDNLYLSSILALRAGDGELLWHYQTTPGDHWDYTATQPLMLAQLNIGGSERRVIMQAPKNGFFYVLDRVTGELLSAKPFVRITWATEVDLTTGRPREAEAAYDGLNPVLVWPDPQGAHNWHPMAFHPATGLVYLPVKEGGRALYVPDPAWRSDPRWWNTGQSVAGYTGPLLEERAKAPPVKGRLIAWDPVRQVERWGVDHPVRESGGVLTTAGNLVLQGRSDGMFIAYRATDGAVLWQFDAGTGIMAPPVTYLHNGVQHITVLAGWGGGIGGWNPPSLGPVRPGYGRILTLALDADATFSPPAYGLSNSTNPPASVGGPPDPKAVADGQLLYNRFCQSCHGTNAVAGPYPDLRYASPEVHNQFAAIVLGGAREALGMPSFNELLNAEQVERIRVYILSRALAASSVTR